MLNDYAFVTVKMHPIIIFLLFFFVKIQLCFSISLYIPGIINDSTYTYEHINK